MLFRGVMIVAAAFALAPAAAHAQARLPDTPAGQRAAALLRTVESGDTSAVRAFVGEQMNEQFQAMPMERHQQMFARMHAALAGGQVTAVTETSPNALEVTVSGTPALRLSLTVESAPPHRIAGLRVGRAGDGSADVAPAALTDAVRAEVVDSLGKLYERNYLLRDSARIIAARLRERLAAGAYASATTPAAFAEALTADIRAVNDDKHLRVLAGPPRMAGPAPQAGATSGGATPSYRFLEGVRMMEGQVGYFRLPMLPEDTAAAGEVARAMQELRGSRAMILDLRGSRGGSAELANVVISHFTAPGLLTLTSWDVADGDTVPRRTLDQVPGPRRVDVPLFVLVDSITVSASEDVAFVLHNLGRATLIGATTRGGGRNNIIVPAGHGFVASISVSKVWDPCTGREWERVGITPDIRVPSAQALDTALAAARTPERYRPAAQIPQRSCRVPATAG